jgi:hypothetical protein
MLSQHPQWRSKIIKVRGAQVSRSEAYFLYVERREMQRNAEIDDFGAS